MSALVWLDYSERERRKMLDVVDLFREKETRDELGIGSVRDVFADLLFPGTSTIMTRARYFLLVPWTYLRLEKQRIPSAQMAVRARRAEIDLVEAIEQSDDNLFNIGKVARSTLKRLPSSVYWQGLNTWGIRTFAGAQVQYNRSLDRYYQQLSRHGGRTSERDTEHDDLASSNWHAAIISPPANFPTECSLKLMQREAEYLVERITLSPKTSGSLLAKLLETRNTIGNVDFAWEHPIAADLPTKLRAELEHAHNFSELMHGAPLLYNLILAEQAHRSDEVKVYRQRFNEWAKLVSDRLPTLAGWKKIDFWKIVDSANPRITPATRDFVNNWWDLTLTGNAAHLCDNLVARSKIKERERRLKKNLARIDNPRAQELWAGDSGTGQLDFRWRISQQLLRDIFLGLERTDA